MHSYFYNFLCIQLTATKSSATPTVLQFIQKFNKYVNAK